MLDDLKTILIKHCDEKNYFISLPNIATVFSTSSLGSSFETLSTRKICEPKLRFCIVCEVADVNSDAAESTDTLYPLLGEGDGAVQVICADVNPVCTTLRSRGGTAAVSMILKRGQHC